MRIIFFLKSPFGSIPCRRNSARANSFIQYQDLRLRAPLHRSVAGVDQGDSDLESR